MSAKTPYRGDRPSAVSFDTGGGVTPHHLANRRWWIRPVLSWQS